MIHRIIIILTKMNNLDYFGDECDLNSIKNEIVKYNLNLESIHNIDQNNNSYLNVTSLTLPKDDIITTVMSNV